MGKKRQATAAGRERRNEKGEKKKEGTTTLTEQQPVLSLLFTYPTTTHARLTREAQSKQHCKSRLAGNVQNKPTNNRRTLIIPHRRLVCSSLKSDKSIKAGVPLLLYPRCCCSRGLRERHLRAPSYATPTPPKKCAADCARARTNTTSTRDERERRGNLERKALLSAQPSTLNRFSLTP